MCGEHSEVKNYEIPNFRKEVWIHKISKTNLFHNGYQVCNK